MDRNEAIIQPNEGTPGFAGYQVEPEKRARRAMWTAAVIIALAAAGIVGLGLLAADQASTNLAILAVLLVGPIISGAIAMQSLRSGNLAAGGWWVIAGIALMTFTVTMGSVLVDNIFPGIGVIGYFAVILFVNLVTEQKQLRAAILWVAAGFLAARAVGLLFPIQSADFPIIGPVTNWVFAGLTVVLLLLVRINFRALNLASKLTGAMIVLVIILSVVMTLAINAATTRSLQQTAGENLFSLARSQATSTADLLLAQVNTLTTFSMSESVQSEVRTVNSSYPLNTSRAVEELARNDQIWREATSSGSNVSLLVNSRLNNSVSKELQELVRVFPQFSEVVVTDQLGGLVAASTTVKQYDYSQEAWWRGMSSGTPDRALISSPAFDLTSRAYVIRMAVPIYSRGTSRLIGMVSANYRIHGLLALVNRSQLGKTGAADLLFTGSPPRLIHEDGLAEVTPEFVTSLEAITGVSGQMDYQGAPSLVSRTPLIASSDDTVISNLGWMIVAHQDTSEAFAPVASQTLEIYRIVSVLATLIAGLATFLVQYVTGPVTRLQAVAERIQKGDLSARAEIEAKDEIGVLASTLNEMTGQLSQTLTGLEQRVAERTRELSISSEVGRALSQEHDLRILLQEAVNRIQQAFDLYYVQIYLTDPAGTSLEMQAGSGEVGQKLQARAHRLSIGSASINGMAAAGKRSVLVPDTAESSLFRPNPLLPDTHSELSVPLIAGERVVGVLDMQSSQPGILVQESMPAFESLASQLAIAVENAALFTQAEEARAAVEAQVRVQTRQGWEQFLDAIHRGEQLGFRYDSEQGQAVPWTGDGLAQLTNNSLEIPIVVSGETVGTIALERETAGWSAQDAATVNLIASQVARRIDGLRLLAQADQYRNEAEEAARRLTRQGWEEFLASRSSQDLSFVYDQNRIRAVPPAEVSAGENKAVVSQPLLVQGQPVGEIAVEGVQPSDYETQELVRTVSARLSDHIESLRLAEQTQEALILAERSEAALRLREQNLQTQNEAISELTRSEAIAQGEIDEALKEITESAARTLAVDRSSIWLYNDDQTAMRCLDLYKKQANQHTRGAELCSESLPAYFAALKAERVIAAENVHSDPATRELSGGYLQATGVEAVLSAPIRSGGRVVGVISSEHIGSSRRWLAEEENFAASLADIVTLAFTAYERKNRALQEQRIRQVSTEVLGAADLKTVMRRAVEQVGRVLGTPAYIYVGQANGNPAGAHDARPGGAPEEQANLQQG